MPLKEFRAVAGTPRADLLLALVELNDPDWHLFIEELAALVKDRRRFHMSDEAMRNRLVSRLQDERLRRALGDDAVVGERG